MPDIAHQFLGEVLDRGEDTPCDDIALDLGKPQFDLVQSRRVRWREMQPHCRMGLQKLGDPGSLVRREVIGNHMNLFPGWLLGDEVRQKGDELFGGMPVRRLAQYFPRLGIERRVQRQRAMPIIFKPMPFSSPGRQGQHRIFAVQGLDGGFLIHAKHGRMLRWVQIQADDVRRLRLELRVGGRHIALQPMRLESMFRPDPRDPHVADPKVGCQFAGTPVCRAVSWGPPRSRACKINCVTGYHASSREEGGFDDQARHENGCVVG